MGEYSTPLYIGGVVFIKINSINYYIVSDNKTPTQIVDELFLRMDKQHISKKERTSLMNQVSNQLQQAISKK